MPQELECVYEVATGKLVYMHSVDAAEACTLGDYTRMSPYGDDVSDQERAAAMAASRGMPGVKHPELQTPEERAESRRLANAAAMPVVSVPVGTPVVLSSGPLPAPAQPELPANARGRMAVQSSPMHVEDEKRADKK